MTKRLSLLLLACGACCVAPGAVAQVQGYFDFGQIPGVPDQPHVQVDLNAALLRFAAAAARSSDPVAADLIAGIEGIRVRVYRELEDADAVGSFVDNASNRLEREGWQRVVYVQDGESRVRIYAQLDGAEISGMTVLVIDDSEAVFINIAGRIDPAELGRVAGAMGMGEVLGAFSGAAGDGSN